MRMPAAVQTAVSAFNATTGGAQKIGLMPWGFQNKDIVFKHTTAQQRPLDPIMDLKRGYGCDCYNAEDLDIGVVLHDEAKVISGIFARKLGEFLPKRDGRNFGDNDMRDRVWSDTRELTLKDLFVAMRTERTVNWSGLNGTNNSGYLYIAGSILQEAIRDALDSNVVDANPREINESIEKVKGKKRSLRTADRMIASAVLSSMVVSSVERALFNSAIMSGAAELYAGLRRPHMSAVFYDLALDMMPPVRSLDAKERGFKNELHSAAAGQWFAALPQSAHGAYYYLPHLFRVMWHAWQADDLVLLAESHARHALYLEGDHFDRRGWYRSAAHAKYRQGLTEVERFKRSGWDMGEDKLNRKAVKKIVSIFDAGDVLLSRGAESTGYYST